MIRKALAVAALAAISLFAVPAAATAAGYTGQGPGTVTVAAGESATLTFSDLPANTPSTATADDAVTLSVLKAGTASKPTDANGSVTYTATASETGTYTITVTAGQAVATSSFSVVVPDSGANAGSESGLPGTGYDVPLLAIWIGGGAVLLGAAFVVTMATVRRSRNNA